MELTPQIFLANVMHKRTTPCENTFNYNVYYITCPLSKLDELNDGWRFGVNKKGLLSFHEKDHGARNQTSLQRWLSDILVAHPTLKKSINEVILVAMPRVFGYVFNPVSFWLCLDKDQKVRAVLCEVNNTFGETHSYLCLTKDGTPINKDNQLLTQKEFHVSPFLERTGHYKFRFDINKQNIKIYIDFINSKKQKQLYTSLTGKLIPYNRKNRSKTFWRHPLVTLKAITLIHWQALRLFFKGAQFFKKPIQKEHRLTNTTE